MDKCARPDANRFTVQQRSWTCTPSAARARVCHAAPSQLSVAQERREFDMLQCAALPLVQPLECALGSSALASPKAKAATARALTAEATCAVPPRLAKKSCASIKGS